MPPLSASFITISSFLRNSLRAFRSELGKLSLNHFSLIFIVSISLEISSNSGTRPDLGVNSDFGRTISFGMNSLFLSTKYSLSLSFLVNSLDSCLS